MIKNNSNKGVILIDASYPNETRLAVVNDRILTKFSCQDNNNREIKGNIYLARVERIEHSLQAVFVDYGGGKMGFLPFNEISGNYYQNNNHNKNTYNSKENRDNINDNLKIGQLLPVQISKGQRGTKGVMMTTYIVLSGRYIRILINQNKTIVSKKIEDKTEKKRLEKIGDELRESEDKIAIIFRSSSAYKTKKEINKDYSYLKNLWAIIKKHTAQSQEPVFIHEEEDIINRVGCEFYTDDIGSIIVSGQETHDRLVAFMNALMPIHTSKIENYSDPEPLFSKYGVERQVASLYNNRVEMRDGGYIVINQAEALVAIDVNSGKAANTNNLSDTANSVNTQAVEVIAQQVMLRDLSGIIVIDFIDMSRDKDRSSLEKLLTHAFSKDKARIKIGKISEFGLLEMTRQRIGHGTTIEVHRLTCPSCRGRGRVRSISSTSNAILRAIYSDLAKTSIKERKELIQVGTSLEVAMYLLNERRREICEIEENYGLKIVINTENESGYDCFFIDHIDNVETKNPLHNHQDFFENQKKLNDVSITQEIKDEEQKKSTIDSERTQKNREDKKLPSEQNKKSYDYSHSHNSNYKNSYSQSNSGDYSDSHNKSSNNDQNQKNIDFSPNKKVYLQENPSNRRKIPLKKNRFSPSNLDNKEEKNDNLQRENITEGSSFYEKRNQNSFHRKNHNKYNKKQKSNEQDKAQLKSPQETVNEDKNRKNKIKKEDSILKKLWSKITE